MMLSCLKLTLLTHYVAFASQDWDGILTDLAAQKSIWQSHEIPTYVYSQQRGSCLCAPCSMARQFVTVLYDVAVNVEQDSDLDCGSPSDFDYKTIDDWFAYIVNVTVEKKDWCSTPEDCPDSSIELTFDATYGYITEFVVDRAAMAYDGGWSFHFDCFDMYQNGQNTNRSCSYTANINTSSSSVTCNSHNCALLYDSCNTCVCSSDGSIACDSQWCSEAYAEYTCNECAVDGLLWLTATSNCGGWYDCDSQYIGAPCVTMQPYSTCKCPSGYLYHSASDSTSGCILIESCPNVGTQLETIDSDKLFVYPSQSEMKCSYAYKPCQFSSECDNGLECVMSSDPYNDCAPLFCKLDVECNPYDCLSDCLGFGYGVCQRSADTSTSEAHNYNAYIFITSLCPFVFFYL